MHRSWFLASAALCLLGCGSSPPPAAPVPSPPVAECELEDEWVHLPVLFHRIEPERPLPRDELDVVDEVVQHVNGLEGATVLRVESHGCVGEIPERTLGRAEVVAHALRERGLPEHVELHVVGYSAIGRGCYCPCEVLEQLSTDSKLPRAKNCAVPLREACRTQAEDIFRTEISVRLSRCPERN